MAFEAEVAAALKDLRASRGLTLSALAQRASVALSSLSEWESGAHLPSHDALVRLTDALELVPGEMARLGFALDRTLATSSAAPTVLGECLRSFRTRQELSQTDLARQLGTSPSSVSNWESGNRIPASTLLPSLEQRLGLSEFESQVLHHETFRIPNPVRHILGSEIPLSVEQVLPDLAETDEHRDLPIAHLAFLAARMRWSGDRRWIDSLLAFGRYYAELLMSADRNAELWQHSIDLLRTAHQFGIDGDSTDAIRTMAMVAQIRHLDRSGTLPSTSKVRPFLLGEDDNGSLWNRITTHRLRVRTSRRPKEPVPWEELIDEVQDVAATACGHLLADLLCDLGEPQKAADLLTDSTPRYLQAIPRETPYAAMADVTEAKVWCALGAADLMQRALDSARVRLKNANTNARPGSTRYVQRQIERQQLALAISS